MRAVIVIAILMTVPCVALSQSTWYVPDDFPGGIQAALSDPAVLNGDTVIVRPGNYLENIDFLGKAVLLQSEKGAHYTVIDGGQSGSVIKCTSGEDEFTVIDGFTITNGTGEGSSPYYKGGGIYIDTSSPTVSNCIFSDNTAAWGGGIYCISGSPTVIDCAFFKNSTLLKGGGMYNKTGTPTVSGCTFLKNVSNAGGGMYNEVAATTVTCCIFTENTGVLFAGGMDNQESDSVVSNCTFQANRTGNDGGGMMNDYTCNPTITSCIFYENRADRDGGGMASVWGADPTVTNCAFIGNSTVRDGGGMANVGSISTVKNCTFHGNRAMGNGGGMSNTYGSNSIVIDCILWGDEPVEIYVGGSTPSVSYTCVEGGYPGTGNIAANPLFVAGPKGFVYLSQKAAGQPVDSPCLDSGSALAGSLGMDIYWTRTDESPDSGMVDMGYHYGPFVYPMLQADIFSIQSGTGGTTEFLLVAGQDDASRDYILLGSATGTEPGIPLPGGHAILPLKWDAFTSFVIDWLNSIYFVDFLGTLNGAGTGTATFDTNGPMPPITVGTVFHFAYALNKPWDTASNPVGVEVLP